MMKFDARSILLAAAATFATLAVPVPAMSQVDIATGLDAAGNLQYAGGSGDAHWEVTGSTNPSAAPYAYVVAPGNLEGWFPPLGGWVLNGPNSSWIAANPFDATANNDLTFTLKFTVSDPSTAAIANGFWTIDDGGTLSLNNVTLSSLVPGDWASLHPFSTVPADFVAGLNVLTIEGGQ